MIEILGRLIKAKRTRQCMSVISYTIYKFNSNIARIRQDGTTAYVLPRKL